MTKTSYYLSTLKRRNASILIACGASKQYPAQTDQDSCVSYWVTSAQCFAAIRGSGRGMITQPMALGNAELQCRRCLAKQTCTTQPCFSVSVLQLPSECVTVLSTFPIFSHVLWEHAGSFYFVSFKSVSLRLLLCLPRISLIWVLTQVFWLTQVQLVGY